MTQKPDKREASKDHDATLHYLDFKRNKNNQASGQGYRRSQDKMNQDMWNDIGHPN